MFGRQDSQDSTNDNQPTPANQPDATPSAYTAGDTPTTDVAAPGNDSVISPSANSPSSFDGLTDNPVQPATSSTASNISGNSGSDTSDISPMSPPASPSYSVPDLPVPQPTESTADSNQSVPDSGSSTDDLLDIKKQALEQLTPLVDELDQPPEEKFRTTMMMIQASDNQSLIKDAYETAQQITDEKAKAQALLDIVNEINYFTQHPSS